MKTVTLAKITFESERAGILYCQNKGCNGYIAKPIELKNIKNQINRLI